MNSLKNLNGLENLSWTIEDASDDMHTQYWTWSLPSGISNWKVSLVIFSWEMKRQVSLIFIQLDIPLSLTRTLMNIQEKSHAAVLIFMYSKAEFLKDKKKSGILFSTKKCPTSIIGGRTAVVNLVIVKVISTDQLFLLFVQHMI